MIEQKIYWKVLSIIASFDGTMYSCSMTGEREVKYKTDKWSMAPERQQKEGYYLLCFDSLESANKFTNTMFYGGAHPILPCLIDGVIKKPLPPINDVRAITEWPEGTVMARRTTICNSAFDARMKIQELTK